MGVLDKPTGKLRLFALEGEYPIRMEPRVPGVPYGPSTAGQNTEFDMVTRRMRNRQYVTVQSRPLFASATWRGRGRAVSASFFQAFAAGEHIVWMLSAHFSQC